MTIGLFYDNQYKTFHYWMKHRSCHYIHCYRVSSTWNHHFPVARQFEKYCSQHIWPFLWSVILPHNLDFSNRGKRH